MKDRVNRFVLAVVVVLVLIINGIRVSVILCFHSYVSRFSQFLNFLCVSVRYLSLTLWLLLFIFLLIEYKIIQLFWFQFKVISMLSDKHLINKIFRYLMQKKLHYLRIVSRPNLWLVLLCFLFYVIMNRKFVLKEISDQKVMSL